MISDGPGHHTELHEQLSQPKKCFTKGYQIYDNIVVKPI